MSEKEVKNINNEDLAGVAAFWNKSGKKLATAAAVLLVAVGAWLVIKNLLLSQKKRKHLKRCLRRKNILLWILLT